MGRGWRETLNSMTISFGGRQTLNSAILERVRFTANALRCQSARSRSRSPAPPLPLSRSPRSPALSLKRRGLTTSSAQVREELCSAAGDPRATSARFGQQLHPAVWQLCVCSGSNSTHVCVCVFGQQLPHVCVCMFCGRAQSHV